MKLYIKHTIDKYEYPIAIADSAEELAEMLGTTSNVVYSSIAHKRKGWEVVNVNEDDDLEMKNIALTKTLEEVTESVKVGHRINSQLRSEYRYIKEKLERIELREQQLKLELKEKEKELKEAKREITKFKNQTIGGW